ncbi:MAG TPA: hypothetical protein VGM43_14460 [Bryobacteraceae bacterium]|jgi:hypothetical protein
MKPPIVLALLAAAAGSICAYAAVIGSNIAALPLTEERIAALPATQQPPGGSIWRVRFRRCAPTVQRSKVK